MNQILMKQFRLGLLTTLSYFARLLGKFPECKAVYFLKVKVLFLWLDVGYEEYRIQLKFFLYELS